jgi:hypothetical protein
VSDTPKTDAFLRAENCVRDNPVAFDWAIGFARNLEREIKELREERDACLEDSRKADEMLMAWFKAASPWATPGSLEEGLKAHHSEIDALPAWVKEELKDGDRLCEAAGVQRTEGGRLPVAKIINQMGRPVPAHRSGGARGADAPRPEHASLDDKVDHPRGAYEPLTKSQIQLCRAWLDRRALLDKDMRTLCDMALNSLLYAEEIDRLRSAPSATAPAGWIAVEDRLPETADPVLIYTPGNKYLKFAIDQWKMQREAPVSFSSATIEIGFYWCEHEYEEVTHWKPLVSPLPEGTPTK